MADAISQKLFSEACELLPGGVNLPRFGRSNRSAARRFVKSAHGAYLVGADGREHVDYVGSWAR
ncbi:MAG: hypothetical protein R3B99_09350 [Polyangiales bacterium]